MSEENLVSNALQVSLLIILYLIVQQFDTSFTNYKDGETDW